MGLRKSLDKIVQIIFSPQTHCSFPEKTTRLLRTFAYTSTKNWKLPMDILIFSFLASKTNRAPPIFANELSTRELVNYINTTLAANRLLK